MWRLRELFRSIKNLIVWFPIIWKDRQWDSWYIEELLLKKLFLMRDYHQKRQTFIGWKNEVKWMSKCIQLLEMLTKNKYWEDGYDGIAPSQRGFSEKLTSKQEWVDYQYDKKDNLYYGYLWEDKARNLFWKIFIWRYEYWWD